MFFSIGNRCYEVVCSPILSRGDAHRLSATVNTATCPRCTRYPSLCRGISSHRAGAGRIKLSSSMSANPNSPSPRVTGLIGGDNVTHPPCATFMIKCWVAHCSVPLFFYLFTAHNVFRASEKLQIKTREKRGHNPPMVSSHQLHTISFNLNAQ